MTVLEQYKKLVGKLDENERSQLTSGNFVDSDEIEDILDQATDHWYKLTQDQRQEMEKFVVELHKNWPADLRYKQAVRILETFPQPHPNDITPAETRAAQRKYWEEQRDAALAEMQKLEE